MFATKTVRLFAFLTFAALGSTAGAQARPVDAARKVILITGSTDGLGRELALRSARSGAHVIVHGRNRDRGNAVVDSIRKEGKGSAEFIAADLGSMMQVRMLADTVLARHKRLDVLINNAGIWVPDGERQVSADGIELNFAVNYLSGYLLTRLLLPRLIASAPSRVINVSSQSQMSIDFADPLQERSYSGQIGYGTTKLMQVMFTIDLAREIDGKGVTVVAVHPASQMDTHLVRALGRMPRSTVDDGATPVMNLVTAKNVVNGAFYNQFREARALPQAYDDSARARLRALSQRLIEKR